MAMRLKLHNHFTMYEFLIPLLLQDKCNLVEDYVRDTPQIQQDLVKFLDDQFTDGNHAVYPQLFGFVRYVLPRN